MGYKGRLEQHNRGNFIMKIVIGVIKFIGEVLYNDAYRHSFNHK